MMNRQMLNALMMLVRQVNNQCIGPHPVPVTSVTGIPLQVVMDALEREYRHATVLERQPGGELLLYPPFMVIPMPIDKDGNGPADQVNEVKRVYEVWDGACQVAARHDTLREASATCALLNTREEYRKNVMTKQHRYPTLSLHCCNHQSFSVSLAPDDEPFHHTTRCHECGKVVKVDFTLEKP